MFDSPQIPEPKDESKPALDLWWAQMADKGLVFHPDDSPHEIVNMKTGQRLFTNDACQKLERIITFLFQHHGEKVYESGHRELMRRMGWQENPSGSAWEPITRDAPVSG
jgi:hypothetical protein